MITCYDRVFLKTARGKSCDRYRKELVFGLHSADLNI